MYRSSPFIGRRTELFELERALGALLSGDGGVFVLEGEPGIGKTRLAREFANAAVGQGVRVLWGVCGGGADDRPLLWPWIHMAHQWSLGINFLESDSHGAANEPHDQDICQPVRILTGANGASFPRVEQIAETTLRTLSDRARSEPIAIIFEDAERADPPSLELLAVVRRELRQVLIVITCDAAALRKSSHLQQVFAHNLLKGVRRLRLKPFERDEFVQVVQSYAGFIPDAVTMRKIEQMSGGNPWFVELIAGAGLAKLSDLSNGAHLTPTVRMAAELHLQAISERARLPLMIAAIIGRRFDLRILEASYDGPSEQVADAIWEGQAAGVIAPVEDHPGCYAFVHMLICEVLRQDLPKGQAARLHKRIAQAMQDLHGFEHQYFAEIATHFFHGLSDAADPRPRKYCQLAAEYAESLHDFPRAIQFYRMALATLYPGIVGVEGLRCDLLLALARAQNRNGDIAAASHSATCAADLAEVNHDSTRFVRAVLVLAGSTWHLAFGGRDAPRIVSLLEKSLQMLENSTEPAVAMVATRLAAELYSRGQDSERQRALLEQATVIAQGSKDPESSLSVLRYRHLVLLSRPDHSDERLSNAEEMLSMACAQGNDEEWCTAFLLRQDEMLRTGDLGRAEVEVAAVARAAHTTGKAVYAEVLSSWTTMRALIDGRFEEALGGARRFLDFVEKTEPEMALALFLPSVIAMLRESGRLDEVEQKAVEGAKFQPWLVILRAALAQVRLGLGDVDAARAMLRALLVQGFTDLERNVSLPLYVAILGELSAELDEQSHIQELYEKLLPHGRYNIVLGPIVFAGPAARYLGILADMQSRFGEAEAHFHEALRLSSRTAARPWIAYTEIDYSRMLLRRDRPGDHKLASGLLDSALKTARALKMNEAIRRAERLKERLESERQETLVPEKLGQAQLAIEDSDHYLPMLQPEPTATASAGLVYPPVEVTERQDDVGQAHANIFKRESDYWTIVFDHKTIRLKHAKGLSMIAWLLRHPRHEFLALTLERLAGGGLVPEVELANARFTRELPTRAEVDDSGPLLDPQARAAYRQRLKELHENCDEARSLNDIGRVSQVEAEIDFLERELCRGVGLGGRTRKWPSETERSRVNVTNAIRSIITRLRKENPELARYLSNTIKTGRFCSFEPDPLVPINWIV
jgi:tetratricopeptide (TPR) repeat protein